jgi:hypothetical protein
VIAQAENRGAAVALYAIAISQSKRIDFESRVYCSGSVHGGGSGALPTSIPAPWTFTSI